MRTLVAVCIAMLVSSHWAAYVAIVMGIDGSEINKWLVQTDIMFGGELLMTLIKKLLDDKKSKSPIQEGEG